MCILAELLQYARMIFARAAVFLTLAWGGFAPAQTTQGSLSGIVRDEQTGEILAGANVECLNSQTGAEAKAESNNAGLYILAGLTPGTWRLRVNLANYQTAEIYNIVLAVGGAVALDVRLRKLSDVWGEGVYRGVYLPVSATVVPFFGLDLDRSRTTFTGNPDVTEGFLSASLSAVIDPWEVRHLPLAARDVYAALVLLPGVTSTTGTVRGLGLSVAGQRPSSSNFLLDGVETNNTVESGPLLRLPPEAVQEYRISTMNYSPEFGETSGFIAHAVTQAGSREWHGLTWLNFRHEQFNANEYQRNASSLGRGRRREFQPGALAGGPLWRKVLLGSFSFESLHSNSDREENAATLPTSQLMAGASGDAARELLRRWPAPPGHEATTDEATTYVIARRPLDIARIIGTARLDFIPANAKWRGMLRVTGATQREPAVTWSPWPGFDRPLDEGARTAAASFIWTPSPSMLLELRAGFSRQDVRYVNPAMEVPVLLIENSSLRLPGSTDTINLKNDSRVTEIGGVQGVIAGRHNFRFGGALVDRAITGYLNFLGAGYYVFASPEEFLRDRPSRSFLMLSRSARAQGVTSSPSSADSKNGTRRGSLFAQDAWRLTPKLTVNFGARYENSGGVHNTSGPPHYAVRLGAGESIRQRVINASACGVGEGAELYPDIPGSLGFRGGASFAPWRRLSTVFRGGFGTYFDHPFDNLWQTVRLNDFYLAAADFRQKLADSAFSFNYLRPIVENTGKLPELFERPFPTPIVFGDLVSGRVHSWFGSVQQAIGEKSAVEVSYAGSRSRHLITTDVVNRTLSAGPLISANIDATRLNPSLRDLRLRSSQGASDYHALLSSLRVRMRRVRLLAAYTWGRVIDNQSEVLSGDWDLRIAASARNTVTEPPAAFTRQFDPSADRADADFDQRHNLTAFGIWELPAHARGWRLAGVFAARSGTPFSVLAAEAVGFSGEPLMNNRAHVADPKAARVREKLPNGERLLDRSQFRQPAFGTLGNTGRNFFRGPGLFNFDLSLARDFRPRWLPDQGFITLRADVFNVLNHANLNNPVAKIGADDFGVAVRGRRDKTSAFPIRAPFDETARQMQLLLRVAF